MGSLVRSIVDDFDLLFPFGSTATLTGRSHRELPANVIEEERGYTIELAAPGLSRGDFEVTSDRGLLHVTVRRPAEEGRKFVLQEWGSQSEVRRTWQLPSGVEPAAISARYEAGILRVEVPTGGRRSRVEVRVE
jgi:HSP20 family protein